jgi:NLPC_P60 stabilising domain, N term/SH3 domain (SH3b1 type)/SH3 domain of SH3b2 type/NlpC/P60 family
MDLDQPLRRIRQKLGILPLLGACLLLAACVGGGPGIADLQRYPQRASAYLEPPESDRPLVAAAQQAGLAADYLCRFFAPWNRAAASLNAASAFWGVNSYHPDEGYGENLLPWPLADWEALVANQEIDRYPSLARPAITVRNAALRVFPTRRPFFRDPRRAGQGYPFDYFQNSELWAGTPLLVTHRSANGAWYLVEAGLANGWLPADALAWTDEAFRCNYRRSEFVALISDQVTLSDREGGFLAVGRLGALFPLRGETDETLQLLVPVRDADGRAVLRTAAVPLQAAAPFPLPLRSGLLADLADGLLGQPYGWGGLYQNRDCSATLHDLFTPFGLWLPRNSLQQARAVGRFVDLAGLTPAQKRARLLAEGVPFYTLVSFPGHIGLYLGTDPASGVPLLLHNLWGVRTVGWSGREGRALVGRLVVTGLHPGEERSDVPADGFYRRLLGFTLLPGAEGEEAGSGAAEHTEIH